MNVLGVLLDLAAARRLTRLIVQDEITADFRESEFFHRHEKLEYLVNCPYCVGVYTSAAVAIASIFVPKVSAPLRYALALAEFQATLKDIEEQRAALAQDYGPPL